MIDYKSAWNVLAEAVANLITQADLEGEPTWPYEQVEAVMIEIVTQMEAAVPESVSEAQAVEYGNFDLEELKIGAAQAFPGAPKRLIDLCAGIAWSVLNGFKEKDKRVVDIEAVKFLQAALDNDAQSDNGADTLGVTSGIIG